MDISEKNLEDTIEQVLLSSESVPTQATSHGIHQPPPLYGSATSDLDPDNVTPGGYYKRISEDYDKTHCLIPDDVFSFIYATQPKEWEKFKKQHELDAKTPFLQRLASELRTRGTLDVLRKGIKANGCKFQLAYFHPSSGLNYALQKLYAANIFSEIRQLRYSERNKNSLDLVLFLNGLPILTAELKNPFTGQNVQNAIQQYRFDRDPREPLFAFGRCLAHFAVDPDLVYMTSHLEGAKTRFLPFNLGRNGGAGNPPSWKGFATAYLWERIWARSSVLNLIQQFIQAIEEQDDKGRKTGKKQLIFPRYHQLDAVRRLVADARTKGPGQRYLIEHSAGSGKSNSISWLAHQLSVLHDDQDKRVFDSIIVITDRRVLDRQLQQTVQQFEQTLGVVENIDTTSSQLKEALEKGKTIIVTTLQKFPVIVDQIESLAGKRFASIYFDPKGTQDKLYAALEPIVERYREALDEEKADFKGHLTDYVRLYAFLSQIITFVDTDLEKLYVFGRLLLRKLPASLERLPVEIQQNIDIDSYRIKQTSKGKITLPRGTTEIEPIGSKEIYTLGHDELEPLSQIIQELNEHFGTDFTEDDKLCIREIEQRLADNEALEASVRVNPPENARLTFNHVVNDLLQDMIDGHFKFYKQVNDDPEFAKTFLDWLFERYLDRSKKD
jgi:type I site-specific restriction-modification system R (restriction) subunit